VERPRIASIVWAAALGGAGGCGVSAARAIDVKHRDAGVSADVGGGGGGCPGAGSVEPGMLTVGLVGYWKLDESGATSPVLDASGLGHDGQPIGAPLPSLSIPPVGFADPASRAFDGTSQYVDLGNPVELNFAGPITLAAWVMVTSFDGDACGVILGHGYRTSPDQELALRLTPEGPCEHGVAPTQWTFGTWIGPQTDVFAHAPFAPSDVGVWVHVAGVYDGEAWRIYTNGVERQAIASTRAAFPVDADWSIGGRPPGAPAMADRFLSGRIDEVRLYDRALSCAEVATLSAQ
jgi:hypothetical protein